MPGSDKILWFEGCGCVPRGDMENCRIRTAFVNRHGEKLYLELSSVDSNGIPRGFVDHCFHLPGSKMLHDYSRCEHTAVHYGTKSILSFVNRTLGGDFGQLRVSDVFFPYRVHTQDGGYALMEEAVFDEVKADRARRAYRHVEEKIRELLRCQYPKTSFCGVDGDELAIWCYASDERMCRAGLDPCCRLSRVSIADVLEEINDEEVCKAERSCLREKRPSPM